MSASGVQIDCSQYIDMDEELPPQTSATSQIHTAYQNAVNALIGTPPNVNAAKMIIEQQGGLLQREDRLDEAKALYKNFAIRLIKAGNSGHAADLMRDLAKWYKYAPQKPAREAARIFIWTADKLYENGMYGWAGSRYYDAAMVFIEKGYLGDAGVVLNCAHQKFNDIHGEDYWLPRLQRHITTLANPDLDDRIKLAILQQDFKKDDRHSWIESTEIGMKSPRLNHPRGAKEP